MTTKPVQRITPCLWFDDQAQAAAAFYTQIFPDGRISAISHYPQSSDNPSGKPRGSVLTVELELAGLRFTALNGGPQFTINPSISFFVHVDTVGEAERLFGVLADGGEVLMALSKYPWSERYGWTKDRFGTSWQVIAGRRESGQAMIVPCLMFADAQNGKAEQAIELYTRVFPDSTVDRVERYGAGEGPEGSVKHARFRLDGQEMIAMDSHVRHGFGFDEGLSLQVACKDQREVDYYWNALSEGGEQGPCGWLKDRFGLSWQIVPQGVAARMTSPDAAARDRAFDAMMKMKKPDIAALQAAFDGASRA